ncbi:MAG TPA: NlpC/P60 family protein [Anaerolineales bacterium]|nr:NlpC/P60 family protein [Anaerolineales bacterium]
MAEPFDTYITAAIDWAEARLGSRDYALRCLAFVEDAYEQANGIELFGGSSASESAAEYGAAANIALPPPQGAFVFYDCGGLVDGERRDWGHVGLCCGNGLVIHAWDQVRCDAYQAVEALAPAPTWDAPRYSGWAPIERVLSGHRPRQW